MTRIYDILVALLAIVPAACQSVSDGDTIAKLRRQRMEVREERLEGGLDKAMAGYQRFLEETPESALTPEAIRRLADLKVEKEYGTIADNRKPSMVKPERVKAASPIAEPVKKGAGSKIPRESQTDFERRATQNLPIPETPAEKPATFEGTDDLERANAREAIALYTKLLAKYPLYERNDQVLYQMSRAYEELGETEKAMKVVDRLIREYPTSRYLDEVQFRRAENYFVRRRYLDAEDAYTSIVKIGKRSFYYELALYKLGWTFYKQELYEEALHRFIALLDQKVSVGYDFAQTEDEQEKKRVDDTFRVISLSFSNTGGPNTAVAYFAKQGKRGYEDSVYGNLGEFYMEKRRYADASASYDAFVTRNPFHKVSPNFSMRIIEIHTAGGFPTLVLESKKKFAAAYGLRSDYWKYFDPAARQEVLGFLKTNLNDLATHYHACYQDPQQAVEKQTHFNEALRWYRDYLASFPAETESPTIHFQMAGLLLENRSFDAAAAEYEKTAYNYKPHDKAAKAGYAAVFARREHLAIAVESEKLPAKREAVRVSLKFADVFPKHDKAAIVLGAAADDLYDMKQYAEALAAAEKLIAVFPSAESDIRRGAWLVAAHSSYELAHFPEAESAYLNVLDLLPAGDQRRAGLMDNLAAAIYKQGEGANAIQDYRAAADHFLRVGRLAPTSGIRATAEYDAAAALIQLKDWPAAATVLNGFRSAFPGHTLQSEVTKKMAFVYKENGQIAKAAEEFERIETESRDETVRRDALLIAADLYEQDGNPLRALEVYRRFVGYFPRPAEASLEIRHKIAEILKVKNDRKAYVAELETIVSVDEKAGAERTPRTRYLAGNAALVLVEPKYEAFTAVRLVKPFDVNLRKKRDLMKAATHAFNKLVDYGVGDVTAAATYYLAEIYAHFSKALTLSERPEGLTPLEMEQYELAIEEQAYPFEEQAIAVHESNLKLMALGVYNAWIEKSLQRLAAFVPAKYARAEEPSSVVESVDRFVFELRRPAAAETAPEEKKTTPKANTPSGGNPASATAFHDRAQDAVQ